jgi:ABC-type uncharacterized transport system auxiliary subunit
MNRKRRLRSLWRWQNVPGTTSQLAFMLLAIMLLSGCLSRPSLVRRSYTFPAPTSGAVATPANGRVLAIRRLMIAAPFAGQSFVYRTGEFSYEQDPYAQFLVPPEESLAEPLQAYFRQAGSFSAMAEPGSALKPDTFVEIAVPELYGDFRTHAAPAAVLALRFVFFDASKGLPGRILSEKTYSRRIPLKARTAAAVMAGWNEALKQIMAEAAIAPSNLH